MGHREHPDRIAFLDVSNVKGEHPEIYPPMISPQPRQRGVRCDPIQASNDLAVKSFAQTWLQGIVVLDLGSKLGCRLRVEFDPHGSKPTSIFFFTSASGTAWTAPVRSSCNRRAISLSQAACTSSAGSALVSERSRRIRANLSRSEVGSSAASRVTSLKVFGIPKHDFARPTGCQPPAVGFGIRCRAEAGSDWLLPQNGRICDPTSHWAADLKHLGTLGKPAHGGSWLRQRSRRRHSRVTGACACGGFPRRRECPSRPNVGSGKSPRQPSIESELAICKQNTI